MAMDQQYYGTNYPSVSTDLYAITRIDTQERHESDIYNQGAHSISYNSSLTWAPQMGSWMIFGHWVPANTGGFTLCCCNIGIPEMSGYETTHISEARPRGSICALRGQKSSFWVLSSIWHSDLRGTLIFGNPRTPIDDYVQSLLSAHFSLSLHEN